MLLEANCFGGVPPHLTISSLIVDLGTLHISTSLYIKLAYFKNDELDVGLFLI